MAKHVAVLMGGWSRERADSLASGGASAAALRGAGYQVTETDVGRDIADVLGKLKPDVAFNALHGIPGRSGMVQSVLELLQIPYTNSGVLASALAMDRHQAKIMFRGAGIPVTDHLIAPRQDVARAHAMPPAYVVKPIANSSKYGVLLARHAEDLPPQELLSADWDGGAEVLVERYIPGRTLSCAVMGNVALGVTEVAGAESAKLGKVPSRHINPASVQPKIYDKVQKMSLRAHAALGCRGVSRTDFRYNDAAGPDGELVCLELDTQPGMTERSLVPEQARLAGHSFEELVAWIVEDASWNR